MPLAREDQKRAEGHGYYTSCGSDASDVLTYVADGINHIEPDRPTYYIGNLFKVTIIVEEL